MVLQFARLHESSLSFDQFFFSGSTLVFLFITCVFLSCRFKKSEFTKQLHALTLYIYFFCFNPTRTFAQNYQESVPQDLKKGNEVMRISATDIDDGNNSRVIYDLEAKMPADSEYFRVDKNTGVIYLDKEIDVSALYLICY